MILKYFRRNRYNPEVEAVYGSIVAQARQPHFYARLGVPDTVSGRFDMIALHAILLFCRFQKEAPEVREFGQDVFDLFFRDMDRNLRELGVGDVSVPKKIKKMAQVFYGSADAYAGALAAGDRQALREALGRNVYSGTQPGGLAVEALAAYVEEAAAGLAAQPTDAIVAGRLSWIEPNDYSPEE